MENRWNIKSTLAVLFFFFLITHEKKISQMYDFDLLHLDVLVHVLISWDVSDAIRCRNHFPLCSSGYRMRRAYEEWWTCMKPQQSVHLLWKWQRVIIFRIKHSSLQFYRFRMLDKACLRNSCHSMFCFLFCFVVLLILFFSFKQNIV